MLAHLEAVARADGRRQLRAVALREAVAAEAQVAADEVQLDACGTGRRARMHAHMP